MYRDITEQCRQAINGSSRTFAASFLCDGITYSDIKSFKISVPSALSGKINIGDTISKSVEIEIASVNILIGSKITVYEAVKLGSEEYEYIPMGKFKVSKSTTKESITTIEADGPLSTETGFGYFSELVYPATTIQMLNEISAFIGIVIETDGLEEIIVSTKPEGYTCREVIGYIAALHGTNAVETREGTIALKWYENCEEDIFTDKIDSPELENDLFVIEKFECVQGDTSIVKGAGFTGISIENPLMTEEIAESVWNKISGFSYRPGTFPIKSGTPCVDPWDSFTYNGERVIAAELEYIHDGGLQNSYKSVGESRTSSASKGPLAQKMDRYYADLLLVKDLMADALTVKEADIRYLKADSISAITLVVKEAAIAELSADFVTVETVEANYANINLSNVEKSTIGTLFADIGLITDATIKDGHVTGFLDAVEVNANSVTAGTLSVDRLVFRGSNKSIIYELNNITGALQAVQSETLNGEILTNRSITVDKIVAKSITANEIATATITANELAANCITSDKIVSNAITSAKIATGAITADKIAAKTITADKIDVEDLFAQDIIATGTIQGVTLLGGMLQTSDEVGTVIHASYYSKYMFNDNENYSIVSPAGIRLYSVTEGDNGFFSGARFYNNNKEKIYIDCDGIYLWNEGKNYCITQTGQAFLEKLSINALSGSLGTFVVPIANGGTGATTTAGIHQNITGNHWTSPVYIDCMGSNGHSGGGGYCTLAELKTAMALNNVNNTADSSKSVAYANIAYYTGANNSVVQNRMAIRNYTGTPASNLKQIFMQSDFDNNVVNIGIDGAGATGVNRAKYADSAGTANLAPNYLLLTGGKLSGDITTSGNIAFTNTGCIRSPNKDTPVFISASGGDVTGLGTAGSYRFANGQIQPGTNNSMAIGSSNYKFTNVYATNGTIQTSDKNAKDNIKPLSDIHKKFFMKLIPVSFTFKDGTSGRTHIGFISQEVEQAMHECGMTDLDFAGFCRDVKTTIQYSYETARDGDGNIIFDKDGNPEIIQYEKEVPLLDEKGNKQYIYSLRYEEFIGLIAHVLQDTVNNLVVMNTMQQNMLNKMAMLEARLVNMGI